MPKRKPAPERRVWARHLNREWQVNLVDGEVLRPVHVVTVEEARALARSLRVFWVSYLAPVRELTGDERPLADELDRVTNDMELESNSSWLFRGSRGTEALVLEHHH